MKEADSSVVEQLVERNEEKGWTTFQKASKKLILVSFSNVATTATRTALSKARENGKSFSSSLDFHVLIVPGVKTLLVTLPSVNQEKSLQTLLTGEDTFIFAPSDQVRNSQVNSLLPILQSFADDSFAAEVLDALC